MRRMILDIESFTIYMAFICAFAPNGLPIIARQTIRLVCLCFVFVFLLSKIQRKILLNYSILLSGTIAYSCIYNFRNGSLSTNNLVNGLFYAVTLYCLATLFFYFKKTNKQYKLQVSIYRISFVYAVLSIVSMIFVGNGRAAAYLFGDKFSTSYLLMLFCSMYYIIHENRLEKMQERFKCLAVTVIMLVLIWWMGCRTGFLSLLLMFFLIILRKNRNAVENILRKTWCVILCVIGALLILFILDKILELRFIQRVILMMGKDITMTDRTRYYARALYVLAGGSALWGYGYASDEMRSNIALGTNLQNGLLQYLAYYGFVGAACLLLTVLICCRCAERSRAPWGLYVLLYGMILASIVEVSYGYVFLITLFLLHTINIDSNTLVSRDNILDDQAKRNYYRF